MAANPRRCAHYGALGAGRSRPLPYALRRPSRALGAVAHARHDLPSLHAARQVRPVPRGRGGRRGGLGRHLRRARSRRAGRRGGRQVLRPGPQQARRRGVRAGRDLVRASPPSWCACRTSTTTPSWLRSATDSASSCRACAWPSTSSLTPPPRRAATPGTTPPRLEALVSPPVSHLGPHRQLPVRRALRVRAHHVGQARADFHSSNLTL